MCDTNHAEQRNWQIKIILMNLLPVAHTIAKPNRNEKIILILIAAVYRMLCALQILRFDRVGRREPAPTTKRNVHLNPVGDGVPKYTNERHGIWGNTSSTVNGPPSPQGEGNP